MDERKDVSYFDGVESEGGKVYINYAWDRFEKQKIFVATLGDEDVTAGYCITNDAKLKMLVNKL